MMEIIKWPFEALSRLVGLIFELTGRFLAILLGMILIGVGVLLTATVIGACIGVPLLALGVLLLIRGLFPR